MILSQTATYALKAVLFLVENRDADLARAEDIAAALKVPRNYLSKILHTLARDGILTSTRGPRGGFRLRTDPAKLTLKRVVETFDPAQSNPACLLGRAQCSDLNPCAAHARWKGVSAAVRTFLAETTIGDLVSDASAREAALR
jgi:Rrf2 family protein